MRVLITGSSTWGDTAFIDILIDGFIASDKLTGDTTLVIQGDAKGAERLARVCAESRHDRCEAMTFRHPKKTSLLHRNKMLKNGRPNLVVVLEDRYEPSNRGARMVARCIEQSIPVYVLVDMNSAQRIDAVNQ